MSRNANLVAATLGAFVPSFHGGWGELFDAELYFIQRPCSRVNCRMPYQIPCTCGKKYPVTGADAGVSFPCACGATVEVPALHVLRNQAARRSDSPLKYIRGLLLTGQLPGSKTCSCREPSGGVLHLNIVCEREPGAGGVSQAEVVGCLLAPMLGWLTALSLILCLRSRRQQYGDDVSVIVPVPICAECRERMTSEDAMRKALRQIPAYSELLDYYLQACIARRG